MGQLRWMALVLVLVGCSGDEQADGTPTEGPTADCTGAEPYAAGMEKTSTSGLTVALMEASPAPPDVGDNSWTIEVTDAGSPVDGLVIDVRPWMPLHGHGLVPNRYVGEPMGSGVYEVETFDLIMPGVWEFTVDLAADGEEPDTVVFALCAEG